MTHLSVYYAFYFLVPGKNQDKDRFRGGQTDAYNILKSVGSSARVIIYTHSHLVATGEPPLLLQRSWLHIIYIIIDNEFGISYYIRVPVCYYLYKNAL